MNGYLFKEFLLPEHEFINNPFVSKETNVEYRKEVVKHWAKIFEVESFKRSSHNQQWEIYLVAESEMNDNVEKYAEEESAVNLV